MAVHAIALLAAILPLAISGHNDVDTRPHCHFRGSVGVCLVGGSKSNEGRVEIIVDGSRGVLCDLFFSRHDAAVVCRMLGYSLSRKATRLNAFGTGYYRQVFNLGCTGAEESILDCPIFSTFCFPDASAGVECYDDYSIEAISNVGVIALVLFLVTYTVLVLLLLFQHISEFVTTISHESTLKRLCYVPFGIDTIMVAPHKGGEFDLAPKVEGVAESSGETIQVEVSTGGKPFTLRRAVLVDGPFQLPEGYRLASDVVYLYSDPLESVRPLMLHLPHWYSHEEGAKEGSNKRDGLVFVTAPHTPSQEGKEEQYKFVLQQEGNFPMAGVGLLQVNSHSTLFGIAFKEKITSKLRYCATHLERKEPSGQKVNVAVTFASNTWQKILRQHCRQSTVKSNPVDFNFQSSEIVGKVQRVIGKEWKASVEGLARIRKEEINYRFQSIRSANDLESAVKMGRYPPTLSFDVVYDTALKYSSHGRPSMVKLFCEGTTGGRLQFNSVVYEEKKGSELEARRGGILEHEQAPAPSMFLLQDYIPELADRWAELGTALGLEHQVRTLQNSSQPPDRCMYSLLKDWLDAGDRVVSGVRVDVSWAFLVRVLRSPAVGKGSVATTIENSYIRDSSSGQQLTEVTVDNTAALSYNVSLQTDI